MFRTIKLLPQLSLFLACVGLLGAGVAAPAYAAPTAVASPSTSASGPDLAGPAKETAFRGFAEKPAARMALAKVNDCKGAHSLPCLTVGKQTKTKYRYVAHGKGSVNCPCYEVPVYSRTVKGCESYEAKSVELCQTAKIVYVPHHVACITKCSIKTTKGKLKGYHHCSTPGTGSAGWSIASLKCNDSHSTAHHYSVARWTTKLCFVKYTLCSVKAFHFNAYPSGTVSMHNGEGRYS